jgi:hypothetical protein
LFRRFSSMPSCRPALQAGRFDSEIALNYPPPNPPLAYSHLAGVAGSTDREERGIKGVRGEAAVAVLRAEVARYRQLKAQ